MFNPARIARFLRSMLFRLAILLLPAWVLAVACELHVSEAGLGELVLSWQFWLRIARDLAPAALAVVAAYLLAARFVRAVYGLETSQAARGVLERSLFGLASFGPWMRVSEGKLSADDRDILNVVGGPGHLVIYNDSAVLLEKGGRFTRVLGKGFPKLEPFEKVYAVVDLRPLRWVYEVSAITKDGIHIRCDADVHYQIDNQGQDSTEDRPFPASDSTIFRAATSTWIREPDQPADKRIMDWGGRVVISETEGNLRTILARYTLDQLIGIIDHGQGSCREEVRRELESNLRANVARLGARILSVELGDIRVEDKVMQQWIEAWQARWDMWATESKALGLAKQVEQLEEAKTLAQVMMIKAIAAAFTPMAEEEQALSSRLVLARLFMVMGRAAADPWSRVFLPPEAMSTLKLLQDISNRSGS